MQNLLATFVSLGLLWRTHNISVKYAQIGRISSPSHPTTPPKLITTDKKPLMNLQERIFELLTLIVQFNSYRDWQQFTVATIFTVTHKKLNRYLPYRCLDQAPPTLSMTIASMNSSITYNWITYNFIRTTNFSSHLKLNRNIQIWRQIWSPIKSKYCSN